MYSLFLLLTVSFQTNLCKELLPMKVIGGTKAQLESFPYMVNLVYEGLHNCAGSLVSPTWALTAPQCTVDDQGKNLETSRYQIVAGSLYIHGEKDDVEPSAQIRGVSIMAVSNFDRRHKDNAFFGSDIAMVRADIPFLLNEVVRVVRLPSPAIMKKMEPWRLFKHCVASGWGRVKDDEILKDMQYLELSLVSYEKCGLFKNASGVCSVDAEGMGGCFGDLGGPLVCQGYQIGICSHMGCIGGNADVWTRVDELYNWITMTITFQSSSDKRRVFQRFPKSESCQNSSSFGIVTVFILMCQIYSCYWWIQ